MLRVLFAVMQQGLDHPLPGAYNLDRGIGINICSCFVNRIVPQLVTVVMATFIQHDTKGCWRQIALRLQGLNRSGFEHEQAFQQYTSGLRTTVFNGGQRGIAGLVGNHHIHGIAHHRVFPGEVVCIFEAQSRVAIICDRHAVVGQTGKAVYHVFCRTNNQAVFAVQFAVDAKAVEHAIHVITQHGFGIVFQCTLPDRFRDMHAA